MSVEASLVRDADDWNRIVERSEEVSVFHRYEALEVIADHSGTTLYPFVGYKGQEPVGLFPVFSMTKGPFRLAVSPPPDLEVSYLGPAQIDSQKTKQRKAERRHRRFIKAVFEDVAERIDPHYTHVRSGIDYTDPRPLIWNDFDPVPRYTYVVDISLDTDDLFMSFSSDVRRNVRNAHDDHEFEITEGDVTDIGRIIHGARERHNEQGVTYTVPTSFVQDLYREMPDGAVRVYTCRSAGQFVGGTITLESDETIYRWQTVADLDSDIPATDLLDWEMIQRAKDRELTRMDLIGANDPRLCRYKAKFNPEVRTHYSLERESMWFDALKSAYMRMNDVSYRIQREYPGILG